MKLQLTFPKQKNHEEEIKEFCQNSITATWRNKEDVDMGDIPEIKES